MKENNDINDTLANGNLEDKDNQRLLDDKFINLIIEQWKLKPIVLWLLSSIMLLSVFGLLSIAFGDFYSHDGITGFLEDYGNFANFTVGTPSMIVFYVMLSEFLTTCFSDLIKNNIIKEPKDAVLQKFGDDYSLKQFFHQIRQSLMLKRWFFISFGASAVFIVIAIPDHLKNQTWTNQHVLSFVISEFMWFVLFGMTILFAVRVLISIWWINEAFRRFNITVRPLYPDGAGGLQPLSRFSIQLSYVLFFFGLQLTLNQVFTGFSRTGILGTIIWDIDLVIVWFVYLALAPIIFFAPIGAAHDAMRNAKYAELLRFSKQFESDYDDLLDNLHQDAVEVERKANKISELRNLYNMVKSFPVWPFQFQKLAQFSATIVSPLLLTLLIDVVASMILNLFSS